jgi:hypothetical protein
MLGISFTLNAYLAFLYDRSSHQPVVVVSPWLLRCAVLVWSIAAPCTVLVAATIRYAIWPAVLQRGGPHSLNSARNLWMHNGNVVLALLERCVLSGLPCRMTAWAVAPLYGCVYVLFSWNMTYAWNDRQHGPQFIYYFLDTTLPGYYCSIALFVLLVVLTTFYALYCTTDTLLVYVDNLVKTILTTITGGVDDDDRVTSCATLFAHVLLVLFLSSLVVRFRD